MRCKVFIQTTIENSDQNVNDWDEDIIESIEADNEGKAIQIAIRAEVERLLHEDDGTGSNPVEHIDIDKTENKIHFSYSDGESYFDEVRVEQI